MSGTLSNIVAAIIAVTILIVMWCWFFLFNHPDYKIVQWSDIQHKCKTGDLILFHALDNYNPIFIGCYYGHIGIVYREGNSPPQIFEAYNHSTERFPNKKNPNGISFADLEHRLVSYRGYVFYKELKNPLPDSARVDLFQFIQNALTTFHYNKQVILNGANKLMFNDSLRFGTNCGEIAYMCMIRLGLLAPSRFKENRKHHLKWLCSLEHTDDGNRYNEPVYVWQEYFKGFKN